MILSILKVRVSSVLSPHGLVLRVEMLGHQTSHASHKLAWALHAITTTSTVIATCHVMVGTQIDLVMRIYIHAAQCSQ